jgi:hypothetical protein
LIAAHYEDSLIIKDLVHVSLYLSSIVSFIFIVMWTGDLLNMSCFIVGQSSEKDSVYSIVTNGGVPKCFLEVIGILMFFANLRDSLVMLGNYDNQHNQLLERKDRLFRELDNDLNTALNKARQNAEDLFGLLVRQYKDQISQNIDYFYTLVMNQLCQAWLLHEDKTPGQQRSPNDASRLERRSKLLYHLAIAFENILSEPETMSLAALNDMHEKYANLRSGQRELQREAKSNASIVAKFYLKQLEPDLTRFEIAGKSLSNIFDLDGEMPADIEATDFILQKFGNVGDFLDDIRTQTRPTQSAPHTDRLVGCGPPPWAASGEPSTCCCMPRIVAVILYCGCCLCCCCGACFARAWEYPKRVSFGCFWFQIVSKLHERQIQGLIISILLAVFLGFSAISKILNGCPHNALYGDWWACSIGEFKEFTLLLALIVHIPSTFLCLVRIKDLDAIIRLMADIRKINGLREVVRGFEAVFKQDTEKHALLYAIEQRVLPRLHVIAELRQLITSTRLTGRSKALFYEEAVGELIDFYQFADQTLGPAGSWMQVDEADKAERMNKEREKRDDLINREFGRAGTEPDTPPSPPITPRSMPSSSMSLLRPGEP